VNVIKHILSSGMARFARMGDVAKALSAAEEARYPALKRSASTLEMRIMGREVVVAMPNGQIDLGIWERIF
jgi:hypothetical protein